MNPYSYIMNNPLAGTDPSGYVANCPSTAMECGGEKVPDPKVPPPEEDNGKGKKDKKPEKIKIEDILKRAEKGEEFIIKEKDGSKTKVKKNEKGIGVTNDKTGKTFIVRSGGTNAQSLKPTKEEYDLVKRGKLAEMWRSRCDRGDPIGCVGFATWGSVDDIQEFYGGDTFLADYWIAIGFSVQFNARTGLLEGNPDFFKGDNRTSRLHMTELMLGKAIARTHLKMTARDNHNTPYFLSPKQITDYHHQVFDAFNVPRKWYGGSYFNGSHSNMLEVFYCRPACDKE